MEIDLAEKRNNFDLLRLLAASMVLISHSFDIRGVSGGDPFMQASSGQYSLSSAGLAIFFVISGFLVSKSLEQTKSVRIFLLKRFLRIWPGLLANILFTIMATGLFFTILSLYDFFANFQTIRYLFLNASMIKSTSWLPGAFQNKPVNVSLWTIPVEVRLYLLLLISYLAGGFRKKYLMMISWFLGVLFFIGLFYHFSFISKMPRPFIWDSGLMMFFLSGSVAYIFRQKLKFKIGIWVIFFAVWVIMAKTLPSIRYVLDFPFFTYTILFFGSGLYVFPFFKMDLSYGIYLYGYPVQVCLQYTIGDKLNFAQYLLLIIIVTALFAVASWLLIERRALALKKLI